MKTFIVIRTEDEELYNYIISELLIQGEGVITRATEEQIYYGMTTLIENMDQVDYFVDEEKEE